MLIASSSGGAALAARASTVPSSGISGVASSRIGGVRSSSGLDSRRSGAELLDRRQQRDRGLVERVDEEGEVARILLELLEPARERAQRGVERRAPVDVERGERAVGALDQRSEVRLARADGLERLGEAGDRALELDPARPLQRPRRRAEVLDEAGRAP